MWQPAYGQKAREVQKAKGKMAFRCHKELTLEDLFLTNCF